MSMNAPTEEPKKSTGLGLVETVAGNQGPLGDFAERIASVLDGYVSKREKHQRALESSRAQFVGRITLSAFILIGIALVGSPPRGSYS